MSDFLEKLKPMDCEDCNFVNCLFSSISKYCAADVINAYQQGISDEQERIVNLLKEKAWVEEDNAYLKFDTVLVPLQRLLDEIVRGGENG